MTEKKKVYEAELYDKSIDESYGTVEVTGEPQTLAQATKSMDRAVEQMDELTGDEFEARDIRPE